MAAVATSIFPVCDIVRCIGGSILSVISSVPAGANPHFYEPSPSLVHRLENVELYIGVHPEFDGWMVRYLKEDTEIHYLIDDGTHEEVPSGNMTRKDRDLLHGGDQVHFNPHIWLSVKNAGRIAEEITVILSGRYPENRTVFKTNLIDFQARLDSLDKVINRLFQFTENKRFIQWHPAWDRFAEDYGLEITATLQQGHGDEPSVSKFQTIIRKADMDNTKVIVVDLKQQDRAALSLRDEIGGRIVVLDTLGDPDDTDRNSYIKLMSFNAHALAKALNQ